MTPKKGLSRALKFLLHFWTYDNSLKKYCEWLLSKVSKVKSQNLMINRTHFKKLEPS